MLCTVIKYRKGAVISGSFQLKKGSILQVAIGQKTSACSAGSGGTFVIKQEAADELVPLVIAGGAGGDTDEIGSPWCDAQLEEYGNGPSNNNNNNLGLSSLEETGGAGFTSNQPNLPSDIRPKCFKSGLMGGKLSVQKYYLSKLKLSSNLILKATFSQKFGF